MGLETVLNQILAAGQQEEGNLMEQAQFERERILADAKARAEEIRAKGRTHAQARLESLRRELLSAAEFEARRQLLVARRELAEDFLSRVRRGLTSLPPNRNQAILTRVLEHARKELPQGTVHARKQDLPLLTKGGLRAGREMDGNGGFQVEAPDGTVVLDYRYDTMLENAWKQILTENNTLFE